LLILPVRLEHVLGVAGLPAVHKDPFDRLLIAQAIIDAATLLTADSVFAHYPVPVSW
jgi:PIN domain nuclease of toxin-antitoxin system